MHKIGLYIATLFTALLLVGCASGPRIYVNENPAADFSAFATYGYAEQLGTDSRKGYRSILSNHLIAATDREMQARGYRKALEPDLLVNFYLSSKEKIRTTSTPTATGYGYYGYRRGYYGAYGGYETTTTQYTEGTLHVDLVDNSKGELAWEGVAVGRINDTVRENLQAAANAAVGEIFKAYSHTAPGFVPPTEAAE